MVTKLPLSAVLLLVCLALSPAASADDNHYVNNLIGERAAGMGGAYTAVSDDAAGLFYNPAGIAYASSRNLSVSVNAYYSLEKTYKGAVAGQDWKRESSAFLPNYFGIIHTFGRVKVGFSYAVPDSSREDQDQTFSNIAGLSSFTLNFNYQDDTYHVGPSVAVELTEDLAVGLTLYGHYRSADVIYTTMSIDTTGTGHLLTNASFEVQEAGLRPVLGLMWSPTQKVALGLSVAKTFLLDSDVTIRGICTRSGTIFPLCAGGAFSQSEYTTEAKRNYPIKTTLGMAWFPSDRFLLSTDVTYHPQTDDETFGNHEAVLNAAIGAEYYLSRSWALRGGAFTDYAATPKIEEGLKDQQEHIDRYGGSLSLSYFTRNTSVTLGGYLSLGSGKAQITKGSLDIQDAEETAWTIFLSSSYTY